MQRRKWDAKTQAFIVLEGLKGTPVAKICPEPQISQSLLACDARTSHGWKRWTWWSTGSSPRGFEAKGCLG